MKEFTNEDYKLDVNTYTTPEADWETPAATMIMAFIALPILMGIVFIVVGLK